jgi:hypothetical protein
LAPGAPAYTIGGGLWRELLFTKGALRACLNKAEKRPGGNDPGLFCLSFVQRANEPYRSADFSTVRVTVAV